MSMAKSERSEANIGKYDPPVCAQSTGQQTAPYHSQPFPFMIRVPNNVRDKTHRHSDFQTGAPEEGGIRPSRHRSTANCFCVPNPRHGSLKTLQPKSDAIRNVPSTLPESTTTICRAEATLRRQSGRFFSSFFTIRATERGTGHS